MLKLHALNHSAGASWLDLTASEAVTFTPKISAICVRICVSLPISPVSKAADLLDVAVRTEQNWETGGARIP